MAAPRRQPAQPRLEALEIRALLSVTNPSTSLLVRFQDGTRPVAIGRALDAVQARVVESFPDGPTLVEFASPAVRQKAQVRLSADSRVLYAQLDRRVKLDSGPADASRFTEQWGLAQANGNDVGALEAWQITTGDPGVIVAVVDSGLDLNHPEFAGRVWTDTTATASRQGPVHGWNFITNTSDVTDDNGHGTHVAGIIAAGGVNVSGVAPGVQIMPLKMIDASGYGAIGDGVRAIYYAVDHGARVINASWSSNEWSRPLADAVRYANSRNVVVVAAAGNESVDNGRVPSYPANLALPNMLSVAAVSPGGRFAWYSNYGRQAVAIAAPGTNILSTVPGGYDRFSGTSMAAPFVSGVVALVVGREPGLTARQLVSRIISTARPMASLAGKVASGGVVNAYNALTNRIVSRQAARAAGFPAAAIARLLASGAAKAGNQAASLGG